MNSTKPPIISDPAPLHALLAADPAAHRLPARPERRRHPRRHLRRHPLQDHPRGRAAKAHPGQLSDLNLNCPQKLPNDRSINKEVSLKLLPKL